MGFRNIMSRMGDITRLKESKVNDFNSHVGHIRQIMTIIGKNSISLNTSEPLGPNHTHSAGGKYIITITKDKVSFLNSHMRTEEVTEKYLENCRWFQVYIYVVEMELELKKIHNHIMDSVLVNEEINGGTD